MPWTKAEAGAALFVAGVMVLTIGATLLAVATKWRVLVWSWN